MDSVNKTLYIPLYGKAYVSSRQLLLRDPWAQEIWAAEGFALKGKAASKWLTYYMAMRAGMFDRWLEKNLTSDAVVLHLGCGMDSRFRRVQCENAWYDVDFPQVIRVRQKYFPEEGNYHMLGADLRSGWLDAVPAGGTALVVMEGISMYLTPEERQELLKKLTAHFSRVKLLMDVYTCFGAKASKYKNPINEVGVTDVHGMDDPREPEDGTGLRFLEEHPMTPEELIRKLPNREQRFFRLIFGGRTARKLYRLYEYGTE